MKKSELEELVKDLKRELSELKEKSKTEGQTLKAEVEAEKAVEPVKVVTPPIIQASEPVPLDYLEAVKMTLNYKFGVQVKSLSDRPGFEFVISVPKEYSNASEPHWETYKNDLRPKLIPYSEGLNGVKEWVTKVFNNFNQDTKTIIALDRAKAS